MLYFMFQKVRRAFRQVLPIDHYWRELLGLAMFIGVMVSIIAAAPFGTTSWLNEVTEGAGRACVLFLFMMGVPAYTFARLAMTHPTASPRYMEFLATTPWTYPRPLPWGSPKLCWQDGVVLVLIGLWMTVPVQQVTRLAYVPPLPVEILLWSLGVVAVWFTLFRGILISISLCGVSPGLSWSQLFLLPLLFKLSFDVILGSLSYWWLIPVPVVLLVVQERMLEESLRSLSDRLLSAGTAENRPPLGFDERLASLLKKPVNPEYFQAGRELGWPFDVLSPRRQSAALSVKTGILVSAWLTWLVVLTIPAWDSPAEIRENVPPVTWVLTGILAGLRYLIYLPALTGPVVRWKLRKWLILREDRALVAPLLVCLTTAVGNGLLTAGFPPPVLIPAWVFLGLVTLLMCGPNLQEHSLTTSTSLRLNKSWNPRPRGVGQTSR